MQKTRAKDKSDVDLRMNRQDEKISIHRGELDDIGGHFSAVGTTTSAVLELINMQLESEAADMVDREMVSLFAGQGSPE